MLDLPPPFSLVKLRELGDAFAHAKSIAAEAGAGTLVHVGRFDVAEFALVLEPDEPLRSARRAFYAGLGALGDAMLAYAPPKRTIAFKWPDAVLVDGALVGGARLAWPEGASEDSPPDWLVFAAMIRTFAIAVREPGLHPPTTTLEEEGFDDIGSGQLVESFTRHFMVATDAWREIGFGEVAKSYLRRLVAEGNLHREIDENGDLLVRRIGKAGVERHSLVAALAEPTWLDPVTGGPRA